MRLNYALNYDRQGRYRPRRETIDFEGLSPDDHVMQVITKTGEFYEHDLLLHLALRGPRGGLFIDVGAHIGTHTVYFAKFLADHVVAVEASPHLQPVLQRNLDANGVTNCTCLNCGAGARPGVARVVVPRGRHRNTGMTRLVADGPTSPPDAHEQRVPVRTLDSIVRDMAAQCPGMPLSLVKIDVEGMELDVLAGACGVLTHQQPQVVAEAGSADEQDEMRRFMARFGYRAVASFCATPTFHFINPAVHTLRKTPLRHRVSTTLAGLRRWVRKVGRAVHI